MKHTIRQHGQLTQIDCELGSGMLDKNGQEICEGDKVTCSLFDEPLFTVKRARDGAFVIVAQDGNCYPLFNYASELEVVGHVAED